MPLRLASILALALISLPGYSATATLTVSGAVQSYTNPSRWSPIQVGDAVTGTFAYDQSYYQVCDSQTCAPSLSGNALAYDYSGRQTLNFLIPSRGIAIQSNQTYSAVYVYYNGSIISGQDGLLGSDFAT